MTLTIRASDGLSLLIDAIHDRWFDVSAIEYDQGTRVITIPFWSRPTERYPRNRTTGQPEPFDNLMAIHDADAPVVEDRERIDIYSFNDVRFLNQQVVIRADPKVRITCAVTQIHIEVGLDRDRSEPS
jgi:hypothetical protein